MNMLAEQIKRNNVNFETNKETVLKMYRDFCEGLKQKYGELNTSFDDSKLIKRGDEWLDIHHFCEIEGGAKEGLDNIAVRTKQAKKEKNFEELNRLKPYNVKEKLCYANKIEHFVLHYLIDIYRGKDVLSGGCWLILPAIFDMEYKDDYKMPYLIELQRNKAKFYSKEEFNYLFNLANILIEARSKNVRYHMLIKVQARVLRICNMELYCEMLGI